MQQVQLSIALLACVALWDIHKPQTPAQGCQLTYKPAYPINLQMPGSMQKVQSMHSQKMIVIVSHLYENWTLTA